MHLDILAHHDEQFTLQPDLQVIQDEHLFLNPDIQALQDEHLRLHPSCNYQHWILLKLPQLQQVFPFQHCHYLFVLYFLEYCQWIIHYFDQ